MQWLENCPLVVFKKIQQLNSFYELSLGRDKSHRMFNARKFLRKVFNFSILFLFFLMKLIPWFVIEETFPASDVDRWHVFKPCCLIIAHFPTPCCWQIPMNETRLAKPLPVCLFVSLHQSLKAPSAVYHLLLIMRMAWRTAIITANWVSW